MISAILAAIFGMPTRLRAARARSGGRGRSGVPRILEEDPRALRVAATLGGLTYPLWRLLAPPDAADPWSVWWGIGGTFALVGILSARVAWFERHIARLFYACLGLFAGHFLVLSHVNDMQPFYALGAFFGVVMQTTIIRDRRMFLLHATLVGLLTASLTAIEPSTPKIAYWGTLWIIVALSYFRLVARLRTSRRQARQRAELEARVAERTRELLEQAAALEETNERLRIEMAKQRRLEEQLRVTQKMDALGRLAGGVAHDYSNFLTAILGLTEVLSASFAPEDPRRHDVDEIGRAAEQAADLTRQLLAFGRDSVIERGIVDAGEVARDMTPMLRKLLGEHVDLHTDLAESVAPILANRSQLEQVILNLVLNARDALHESGRVTLEIRDARDGEGPEDLDGACVCLAVSDTGVGMNESTRERIFEPFFTTKAVGKGTGLGLAIVYGIVERGGGRIRVTSRPGHGSRFEVFWPAGDSIADAAPPHPDGARAAGDEGILVVEDQAVVRGLVRRILAAQGYRVLEAADPEAALRMWRDARREIDLVLTDVVMPRMSGFELAEHLAADGPGPRMLFMSGYLDHPSLGRGRMPEGASLLAKPFSAGELTRSVRHALDAA